MQARHSYVPQVTACVELFPTRVRIVDALSSLTVLCKYLPYVRRALPLPEMLTSSL